jgi:prolyl-tRNA synthetase
MPVVAGEKPENERFPGAVATFSIEAMMQDGKALQAGTSHYLGTGFAEAAGIRYQDREGGQQLCHTTSWGVSTRLIGGVIMTHGDDDGLRVPPLIAPHQIVIVPMLRDVPEDEALIAYCRDLTTALAALDVFREPVRVHLDLRAIKSTNKRWSWVKKGAPLIVEIGGRDMAGGNVSWIRRDALYNEAGKLASTIEANGDFVGKAAGLLAEIQAALHGEAKARLNANIVRGIASLDELTKFYAEDQRYPGWIELGWSRPTGAELEAVIAQLKTLKLTVRNTPMGGVAPTGQCIFTGKPAVETIYVARSY